MLFGAWGEGFIPPSTEELGTNPDGYGGFNRHLVAATSNSFECGARGTLSGSLEYDVTAFAMTTTNDFDRYRIPGRGNGEEGTFFKNVGATKRYGLELSARYQPFKTLTLQVAYTYSHFRYDLGSPIPILMDDATIHKEIGRESWLPNSPRHQIAASARYEILPGITVSLYTETLSRSYIDGANLESESVPGYTLTGGQIVCDWRLGGFNGVLSFQARNLGNVKYVAFTEPDPGGNSYQPGAGREFFGGLRILL